MKGLALGAALLAAAAAAAPAAAKPFLPGGTLTSDGRGVLSFPVRCDGAAACAGTLTLRANPLAGEDHFIREPNPTLASGRFSVPAGERRIVRIPLTRRGRVYLEVRRLADARLSALAGRTPLARRTLLVRVPRGGLDRDVAPRPSRCRPRGTEVVRKFAGGLLGNERGDYPGHVLAYGCLYGTGREFYIEDNDGLDGTFVSAPVRVAGPYVAFREQEVYGEAAGSIFTDYDVPVFDLRTGKRLRPSCAGFIPSCPPNDDVLDIELTRTGAAAWSGSTGIRARSGAPGARIEQLDSGPGIEPRSLRLRGSTLSWVKDGVRRFTELR